MQVGKSNRKDLILAAALTVVLFGLYAILPSARVSTFASPDETAFAVTANTIAAQGRAFLPESFAFEFPWLHPRSWVSVGGKIAPVGFLGWPAFVSLWRLIFGQWILPWIGALAVLSAVWPAWQLLRRFGHEAAWLGVLVVFTYPAMILYADRGLFANAPVIAGALWGMWLLQWLSVAPRRIGWYVLTGLVLALTGAMRPLELVWLAPWWIWAGWSFRPKRRELIAFLAGLAVTVVPVLWLAQGAYGSWSAIGYWLKDNPSMPFIAASAPAPAAVSSRPGLGLLPFGFHPRDIWWNVRIFLLGLVWPWTALLLVSAFFFLCEHGFRIRWSRQNVPFFLAVWTVAVLLLIYGNGLYADNILGTPAIGNSFLRYLLPLAPLCGLALAWMWSAFRQRSLFRKVGFVWIGLLVLFGAFLALAADDEGLLTTRGELVRYAAIHAAARQWFKPGDIIFSDRSDKIFFPEFRAVSPIPPMPDLGGLASKGIGLGLFARPLSQAQKDEWLQAGLEVQELGSFGREELYRLLPH